MYTYIATEERLVSMFRSLSENEGSVVGGLNGDVL